MIDTSLSRREREALRMSAEGLSPSQIADEMFVTPATVNKYMDRARRKLGALTNMHAVLIATRANPALLAGTTAQHGTEKALTWHEDHGIPLCGPCEEYAEVPAELSAPVRSPYRRLTPPALSLNSRKGSPVECGTIQAANRHIREGKKIGELTCACPEAYRAWWQAYRRTA
jgi:DNA-binding CsgD family transcriptional regulator